MSKHAQGTFVVKLTPEGPTDAVEGVTLGKLAIDKQFSGDLEGKSLGTMLSAVTSMRGSAGYVALERVSGTLHGLKGSFVLQHSGTIDRSQSSLKIQVVPDSGTEDFIGLTGSFAIRNESGKHFYDFVYEFARSEAS